MLRISSLIKYSSRCRTRDASWAATERKSRRRDARRRSHPLFPSGLLCCSAISHPPHPYISNRSRVSDLHVLHPHPLASLLSSVSVLSSCWIFRGDTIRLEQFIQVFIINYLSTWHAFEYVIVQENINWGTTERVGKIIKQFWN